MNSQIGQKLQQVRQERSLTLEQVSETTRIRVHYLQAIEAGELDRLPSIAQARGFLRAYAGILNLDIDKLLTEFSDGNNTQVSSSVDKKSMLDVSPRVHPIIKDAENAAAIFQEVGQSLKNQRELLGLSLDDIERHTHLRQHYLKALEEGSFEGLPSPVQGRGMLKNYATFLGIDPEPLLLRFADGLQARFEINRVVKNKVRPLPTQDKKLVPVSIKRLFSADMLLGVTLIVSIMAFVFWGGIRIFAMSSAQTPTSTAPSIVDVLLASPTATSSSTPEPATPTLVEQPVFPTLITPVDAGEGEQIPSSLQENNIEVYINVRQRTWLRVTVDGEVLFDGRVISGSAYPFVAESQVEILTGNGAALQVFFNDVDLGPIGVYGQVVNRIYSLEGIITPTPTILPTSVLTQSEVPAKLGTNTPQPGQVTVPAIP